MKMGKRKKITKSLSLVLVSFLILIMSSCLFANDKDKSKEGERVTFIKEELVNITNFIDKDSILVEETMYPCTKETILIQARDEKTFKLKLMIYDVIKEKIINAVEVEDTELSEDERIDGYYPVLTIGDYIYIYQSDIGVVKIYDKSLRLKKEIDTKIKNTFFCEVGVYEQKEGVFIYDAATFSLTFTTINDESPNNIYKFDEKTAPSYSTGIVDDANIYIYESIDEEGLRGTYFFDINNKKFLDVKNTESYFSICGSNVVESSNFEGNEIRVINPFSNRELSTYVLDKKGGSLYNLLDEAGDNILSIETMDNTEKLEFYIKAYDVTSNKKAELEVDDFKGDSQVTFVSFVSFNTELTPYALLKGYTESEDNSQLYIWNFSKYFKEDTSSAFENVINNFKESKFNETNLEIETLVEYIEEKHQIEIFYGEKAVRYFPDFAVTQMTDNEATINALNEIKALLDRLPEGFMKEFKSDTIKGYQIYLCSTLVQGSSYGIASPAAFALEYDGYQMMVLDCNMSNINNNIAHELSHAIDNKLFNQFWNDKIDSFYSNWDTLNPNGFEYFMAYLDEEGNEYDSYYSSEYTTFSEDDVNNVYFVDGYAKTFETEDRARIFEYILGNSKEVELPECFESEKIRNKINMMSEHIREGFSSVGEEKMYWETWFD